MAPRAAVSATLGDGAAEEVLRGGLEGRSEPEQRTDAQVGVGMFLHEAQVRGIDARPFAGLLDAQPECAAALGDVPGQASHLTLGVPGDGRVGHRSSVGAHPGMAKSRKVPTGSTKVTGVALPMSNGNRFPSGRDLSP